MGHRNHPRRGWGGGGRERPSSGWEEAAPASQVRASQTDVLPTLALPRWACHSRLSLCPSVLVQPLNTHTHESPQPHHVLGQTRPEAVARTSGWGPRKGCGKRAGVWKGGC